MKFELDDEHYEFADVVDDALSKTSAAGQARALIEGSDAAAADVVQRLVSLGVPALTVPEANGGSGLRVSDCVLVLELLGRHLVPDTVAEGLAVAVPVLTQFGGGVASEILTGLADGTTSIAVQDRWSGWAPWAGTSAYVMVVEREDVLLVAPSPDDITEIEGIDGTRCLGRVGRSSRVVATLAAPAAEHARARAAVMAAAVVLGVSRAMIDTAVAYAKDRTQFGRAIGSFQAVKHQLADAFAAVEASRRTVWWASLSLDTDNADWCEAVSVAKATASEAARQASYAALQVHGGIGYTWECDLHLWMNRSQVLQGSWGGADAHYRKLQSLYRSNAG